MGEGGGGGETARAPEAGRGTGAGVSAWADLDFVRGLIEAVDGSGIDSVEITRAGTRVKISKSPPSGGGAAYYAPPAYPMAAAGLPMAGAPGLVAGGGHAAPSTAPPSAAPEPAPSSAVAGAAEAPAPAAEESGLIEVKSPMVGTFYRAPAPEAPPYVEVGSRVTKGQTLCILEAMKLMNELESEVEGVVRHVLVENAEPVEYGQALFRIDPNG